VFRGGEQKPDVPFGPVLSTRCVLALRDYSSGAVVAPSPARFPEGARARHLRKEITALHSALARCNVRFAPAPVSGRRVMSMTICG
jgi:hypothetical protein